jgi:spore coat protein CotH
MQRAILLLILGAIFTCGLMAQDFYDIDQVNEIRLYFTQANWDQILDQYFAAGLEQRLMGTAVINGVTYDSVGVRYKGNSSYNANRTKNPFNIKLDYIIDDQLLDGKYGTIKLSNGFSDPSLVRETLSYEIARKYMPASKANYANVFVNDVRIGVYTSVQDVDSYFMRENLHCSGMPRFKCDTNVFSSIPVWGYLGADSLAYTPYYALESNSGWDTLVNFTNTMSNSPSNLPDVMNIDQNLWMIAFDNLLVNLDSPIHVFHNFYLFADKDNRINPLLWDLNMSFGGFAMGMTLTTMQNMDPLRNQTSTQFLLISRLMANPRFKKMYLAHMKTMIIENFSNGWYLTRANELQAICGPSVQADANFFYTYANFLSNINNSVTGGGAPPGQSICGITQLMNARMSYLNSHAAFQGIVPTLSDVAVSPQTPAHYGSVTFNVTAANATYAQLGIRQNIADKFEYHQMYDDGMHSDGSAGDGVFGVTVQLGYGDVQYYFWAESATQGAFLPVRAEYEFFELPLLLEPGELVINEIMAKNTTFADPFGEYEDWVEIYNPNDYPVDIGGMYMTDNHYGNGISAWTQIPTNAPALTTIPPFGHLIVWFDEDLDQGPLHINDKLGGAADAVYLIDSDGSTVIDTYSWTAATGLDFDNVSIGRLPDGGNTWQLFGAGQTNPSTPGTPNQGMTNSAPVVSNVSYSPVPAPAATPITVSATVTDADNDLASVQILWGVTSIGQNTVTMTLQGGRYTGNIPAQVSGTVLKFAVRATDALNISTTSAIYNLLIGYQIPTLYINEIMASNTSTVTDNYGDYEDWVEIYNPNDFAVNLAGFYFEDDHYEPGAVITDRISYAYPDSTTIPARGFMVIWFDEEPGEGILHIDRKISTSGDAVYLIAPDMLTVVDQKSWTATTGLLADLSYGRYPNGTNNWMLFGGGNPHPVTPGTSNSPTSSEDDLIPPARPALQIYPNPASEVIHFDVMNTKEAGVIKVYNLRGQMVRELPVLPSQKLVWDGSDRDGNRLGNGIYFCRLTAGKTRLTEKLVLLK